MMKTKMYEPPYAEIVTIEMQGVLCASSVSGTGTTNLSMSAGNSAIVM